jgi:hypothetical protein
MMLALNGDQLQSPLWKNTDATAFITSQLEHATLLSHFLQTSPSLRILALMRNVDDGGNGGDDVSNLLECLTSNKWLVTLLLSYLNIERPVFLETIISTSKSLSHLVFKEHETASFQVAQALRKGLVRNQTLGSLNLVGTRESKSHLEEVMFGLYDHPRLKILFVDTPLTDTFATSLRSLLQCNSSIEHLVLGVYLEVNAVPAGQTCPTIAPILAGLACNKGIQKFRLSGVRGNMPFCASAWKEMLETNTIMKELDLSTKDDAIRRNSFNYKVGHESACAITKGLCMNTTLAKLDLSGCLNADSFDGAAWQEMLSHNTALKELVLKRCDITDIEVQGISDGLAQNKSLRVLDVSSNRLGSSAVQSLSVALSHNTTLESLNLAFTDDGAMAINAMLEANTFLRRLNISQSLIEAEGGLALSAGLSQNNRLESLDLSHNLIGTESFRAICLSIRGNTSLREFNVESNNIRFSACQTELNGLFASPSLRTLRLGNNHGLVTEGDELRIQEIEGATFPERHNRGIELLAEGLRTNETLVELGLQNTYFDNIGLGFLAEALTENSTLETLDVANNEFDSDGALHFLGLLPAMKGLKETNGFLDHLNGEQVCVALAESLRENEVFCRLSKTPEVYSLWRITAKISLQLKDEIHYRLKMNEYGRRLFQPPLISQLPVAIWPHMLATASAAGNWSLLFHFLQNLPPAL